MTIELKNKNRYLFPMTSDLKIQATLWDWVTGYLGVPQKILGGLPPCPYASEALIKSQVKISVLTSDTLFQATENALTYFPASAIRMHLLVVEGGTEISTRDTEEFVRLMREKYYRDDLWLLFDHPAIEETVGELCFNQGDYLLFMIQKLSDLVLASRDLKSRGYYQSWAPEYYEEVVGLRESYFRKFQSRLEKDSLLYSKS